MNIDSSEFRVEPVVVATFSRPLKIALIVGAIAVVLSTVIALLVVYVFDTPPAIVVPTATITPVVTPIILPTVPPDAIQQYFPLIVLSGESAVLSLNPTTFVVQQTNATLGLNGQSRLSPDGTTMGLTLIGNPYFQLVDVRTIPTTTNLGVLKVSTEFPAMNAVLDFCFPTNELVILLGNAFSAGKAKFFLRVVNIFDPMNMEILADYTLPFPANQLQLNAQSTVLFVKNLKLKNGVTVVQIKRGGTLAVTSAPIVIDAISTWDLSRLLVAQNMMYVLAGEPYEAGTVPGQSIIALHTHLYVVDLSNPAPVMPKFNNVFEYNTVQAVLMSFDQEYLLMAAAGQPFTAFGLRTQQKITIDTGTQFRAMQQQNQAIQYAIFTGNDDTGVTMKMLTFDGTFPFSKTYESPVISLGVALDTFEFQWLFDFAAGA